MFYYNGLRNWPKIKGYLMDTCLSAQDNFKILLDKFRIKYRRERVPPLAGTEGFEIALWKKSPLRGYKSVL